MVTEENGLPPSYAEAKKMKLLAPQGHECEL